jgi:DNA-binding transcriptional ArsR family regulator
MTETNKAELEGITLATYLYAVKKNKPVGPRDVMKSVKLSSPSVAYRHLQKLEDAGYLAKNEYGEYTVKRKASIRGYIWLGSRLVPKMWLYGLLFLGILVVEIVIFGVHFEVETYEFKVFFLIITAITGLAFAVFAVEGALLKRRMGKTATE